MSKKSPLLVLAIQKWIDAKTAAGRWEPQTIRRAELDLGRLAAVRPLAQVSAVNEEWLAIWMEHMTTRGGRDGKGLALGTQKSTFALVKEFLGWCAHPKRGWLPRNPAELVERDDKPWIGKRAKRLMGRGKRQLRSETEARLYEAAALAQPDPQHRIAALLPLLALMRNGEIRHLQVGDCDFTAFGLWVRADDDGTDETWQGAGGFDVKSASSRRVVDMPTVLIPDFKKLCAGQRPEAYLLRSTGATTKGRPFGDVWLWKIVRRVCIAANVNIVCPHGLRGTGASLRALKAQKQGTAHSSPEAQAAASLGHSDRGTIAKQHYIGVPERIAALNLGKVPGDDSTTFQDK